MPLRLLTWNINSVRLRFELLAELARTTDADVVCLQEIKCSNEDFPADRCREIGFGHVHFNGQPGYHGVATLSKLPSEPVARENLDRSGDARHLAVTIDAGGKSPVVVHNVYVPSGGDVPDARENPKFEQKLEFLRSMARWTKARAKSERRAVLVGDLNVAPLEHDVWSHKQLLGVVSHTPVEVALLTNAQRAGGWHDVMRGFVPAEEKLYTWWSYRAKDWRASNRGRRLDHVWASAELGGGARSMRVLDEVRGWDRSSDHAPVLVELAI